MGDRKEPRNGKDSLNFAEFPIACISERAPRGLDPLWFEDQIPSGQNIVSRRVEISPSSKFGLPNATDDDVIFALLQRSKEFNNFTSPKVHFTSHGVVHLLGWPESGQSYRRLENSMLKWLDVTLRYYDAWWCSRTKTWVSRHFHLLDQVTFFKSRGRRPRGDVESLSSFTWNSIVFESLAAGYVRAIDTGIYFGLKSSISRRLYRFAGKKFYKRPYFTINLKVFACEHMGLSRDYSPAQIMRIIEPALQELVDIGFLAPMSKEERFIRENRSTYKVALAVVGQTPPSRIPLFERKDEYAPHPVNDDPAVVEDLVLYKVSHEVAIDLYNRYGEDRIRTQLKFFEWRVKKGHSIGNSAGYLVKAIEKNYGAPDGFVDAPATSAPKPQDTALVAALAAQKVAREATAKKIEDYLSSLDEDELREIEEKALATASEELLEAIENATLPSVRNALVKARIREYVGSRDSD